MKRLWLAVGLLVAVTLIVVVGVSGVFSTDTVEVAGVDAATARQIKTAADVPLGKPLARIDTGAIAADVAKAVPQVTSVDVQRKWPHTIRISASPRTVAANVTTAGTVRWVDPSGVVFGPADEPRRGVPSIVLLEKFSQQEQSQQQAAVTSAITVVGALPAAAKKRVVRVEYRSADDISVILNPRGVRVQWGSAQDSVRKAVVLAALLPRKAAVYDVSAPDLPTTKGKEPGR